MTEEQPLTGRRPVGLDTDTLLDVLPGAVIMTSSDGRILAWNRQAEEIYGWQADEVVGLPLGEFLVPVAERDDLTDHLQLALQAGGLGTFRWDMAAAVTTWDSRMEALFGLGPGAFDGRAETYISLLHPDDAASVVHTMGDAVVSRTHYTVEHRVVWPDGSVHWVQVAGQPRLDPTGRMIGTIGCVRDVTAQKEDELRFKQLMEDAVAAATRERINAERLEFLSRINEALAAASDRREVMANVTRATVPRLGDWCAIYVLAEARAQIPEVEIAHIDPRMRRYALDLQDRFPYDPDATMGIPEVIRSGQAQFFPDIDETVLADLDATDEARQVVRDLGLRSAITVPLAKRGRILGAMQFVMSSSNRRYTETDLTLAVAVASRIASSLENLRLSEEQRSIAAALQASLLPQRLPQIPGVDLAVRYWANGERIEVGGDFYDVFSIPGGRWAIVIGDVCGTGPVAAAVTGLVRHTVASAARHGDDHVTVLSALNDTMLEREAGPFCTVLYGTLDSAPEGITFTFASGGHPLPVVARVDGSVDSCGTPGTLIGALGNVHATPVAVPVEPGDFVVLYTDGVTDVAPPHGLSADDFAQIVSSHASLSTSAQELADRLHIHLASILPIEDRHDDIALLILRATGSMQDGSPSDGG